VLLHLIDIAPPDPDADPVKDARTIVAELKKFAADLAPRSAGWSSTRSICWSRRKRAPRQGDRAAAALEGAGIADFGRHRCGHR
jgi:GTPase involved in cell partitioning and DNA repair